jgi:glycosyltransferase involved in cell wall biosynthesis
MDNKSPLRVCYFGTYRGNYSRNQMMIAGLRLNGVEVIECHQTLWHGIEDRVRVASGDWMRLSFWWRVFKVYWRLSKDYFHLKDFDILMVGYPGQFDVFPARILSWVKRKPLVWDVFMSIYLISIERELDQHNQFSIKLLHFIEGIALKLPNLLILDTNEYVNWFTKQYKIKSDRFRLVPTGADERIFSPIDKKPSVGGKFRVLYAGTFIPNHGVMHIVEAAKYLEGETDILFELIGTGPDLLKAQQYVTNNQLGNVKFHEWMEKDQLTQYIGRADVCLGAFGTTPQSMMTVQNKIYETIAMAKPLISGDSPAARQVFTHGENIYFCERDSGRSLADAIMFLKQDESLREKIAQTGYILFTQNYNLQNNGKRFCSHLLEVVS